MWTTQFEAITEGRTLKLLIARDSLPVSYSNVLHLWQHEADFRSLFIDALAACPFEAFRWETPPVNSATMDRRFECVLLNSPSLARVPDPGAFAEHFSGAYRSGIVEFPNLGKDAVMVVPRPPPLRPGSDGALPSTTSAIEASSDYGHLVVFLRHAPDAQRHALWQAVGAAMMRRMGSAPVWLSTAGAGVSWLHMRLDVRPKYYGFGPYRDVRTE